MLTKQAIDRLEELLAKATPGPYAHGSASVHANVRAVVAAVTEAQTTLFIDAIQQRTSR